MDELPCDDGLSVSGRVSHVDWHDDAILSAQIGAMDRQQRHQAAYLALRRLQAPLLGMEMPAYWGIDPAALGSLIRRGGERLDGEADEGFLQAIGRLTSAPLFNSEVESEFAESFQLEAIGGWLMLGEALGEMSATQTETLIYLARELADYLDGFMENSSAEIAGEEKRNACLTGVDDQLRSYGLRYFGTMNLAIELECHKTILAASDSDDLLASEAGRRLLVMCDEYSGEMLSVLRSLPED
ncbi:hypothetical protein [Streptomyces thermoalcalitolerans]|uniref:Uncharacterized protein n=1 Tax=Streptomyces thermoalcalitolerans TaxID=65605 RepID=A0ABP3YRJ1_9ACTN